MAAAKRKTPRDRELRLVASNGARVADPRPVRPERDHDGAQTAELAAALDLARDSERDAFDVQEVPAAVLCAHCGMSDCPGSCEDLSASGVFVLVPWERPNGSFFRRLFATARATTLDAEPFFERLADGPIAPALTFALASEMVASAAVAVLVAVPVAFVFPELARQCLFDPEARRMVLAGLFFGVPGLAGLLVLAHALHGLSIDLGARLRGARPARSRALRFGLYATGWDLVVGPVGAVVLAFTEGPREALSQLGRAAGLPTRATRAFLKSAYRLEGEPALSALRVSYWGAGLATMLAAAGVVGALAYVLTMAR